MKFRFFTQLLRLIIIILASTTIVDQPLLAQTRKYTCGTANYQGKKVPATLTSTIRGENMPLIYWVSSWSGLNPQQRCEEVSQRLQAAYDNNVLKRKYLTTGKLNDNPVICIRREKGKDCEVILTLKPGENAQAILQKMLDFRSRLRKGGVPLTDELVFYDNGNTYIDIELFLKQVSLESE